MCRFCPSGIASGTTQTAARTAAPRYEPKSRQNNQSGFVPLAEDCGSSSLREERPRWKRDSGGFDKRMFYEPTINPDPTVAAEPLAGRRPERFLGQLGQLRRERFTARSSFRLSGKAPRWRLMGTCSRANPLL